jgi:hypothetical protein
MKMKKSKLKNSLVLGLLLIIFMFSSTGCTKKVMWVGNNLPGHMTASYKYFSGVDTGRINAEPGEIIIIKYSSEVKEGELTITITNKKGESIEEIPVDEEGIVEIPIEDEGKYRIRIEGKDTKGSFDLKWESK